MPIEKNYLSINNRMQSIDFLRGIAIIFIILAHSDSYLPWKSFNINNFISYLHFRVGVPLFFVISGYCISMSLASTNLQYKTPLKAFKFFYRKRFWRIQPLAIFWVTVIILMLSVFRDFFSNYIENMVSSIFVIIPIGNFRNAYADGGLGYFGVYWSLGIEEQFYILFPFIFFYALEKNNLLHFSLIFIILSNVASFFVSPFISEMFWYQSIMFGVVIYALKDRITKFRIRKTLYMKMFTICLILFLPFSDFVSGDLFILFVPIVCFFIVICSFFIKVDDWITRLTSWIGLRSYGLYLSHLPCAMLSKRILHGFSDNPGPHTFLWNLAGYALWGLFTFGSTEVLYRYLEQPLIRLGHKPLNSERA